MKHASHNTFFLQYNTRMIYFYFGDNPYITAIATYLFIFNLK